MSKKEYWRYCCPQKEQQIDKLKRVLKNARHSVRDHKQEIQNLEKQLKEMSELVHACLDAMKEKGIDMLIWEYDNARTQILEGNECSSCGGTRLMQDINNGEPIDCTECKA